MKVEDLVAPNVMSVKEHAELMVAIAEVVAYQVAVVL